MIPIFKAIFRTKSTKSKTSGPFEEIPTLEASKSEPVKRSSDSFKKISVKLNSSLTIRLDIPKNGSAEINCGWLLKEAKRKFQEQTTAAKYRNEIQRIISLRTVEGFLPIDYCLTLPESGLQDLPDKLALETILSPEDSAVSGRNEVSMQDFDLYGCLGRGAFANVYLARRKQDARFYAIKQLKKGQLSQKEIDKLISERDVMLMCQEHKAVRLYFTFQTDEYCYFVMQYCAAGDLFRLIHDIGPLTEIEAKYFIKVALEGLKGLHSKGILYRDLKAENMLMDLAGNVYLTDFGLSKSVNDPDLNNGICGTPEFCAPEIIRNEGYSFVSDYYSLGTMTYELVLNESPFKVRKDLNALYNDILLKKVQIPNDLSPNLQGFLRRLFDKNPQTRLGSQGIEEIMNHPWLADAPTISQIHPSLLVIEKLVKGIDVETDKGILIDGNDKPRSNQRQKSNRIIGFSMQNTSTVDSPLESEPQRDLETTKGDKVLPTEEGSLLFDLAAMKEDENLIH